MNYVIMLDYFFKIIDSAANKNSNIPPTLIYNEGWLLRLVLKLIEENKIVHTDITFLSENCKWYSEALLPSLFLPRYRGDKLAESWTHADGVVGKIYINFNVNGALTLYDNCDYFYIIEAKIFSKFSTGTKNAKTFNQAARNVACIAKLIMNKDLDYKKFKKLAFYVLLPEIQRLTEPTFKEYLDKNNIKEKILERIKEYPNNEPKKEKEFNWIIENINDFLNCIEIKPISWESIINNQSNIDLINFYNSCIKYNQR